MNKIILTLLTVGLFASCANKAVKAETNELVSVTNEGNEYDVFGEGFDLKNTLTKDTMFTKYEGLKVGDTIQNVQFETTISSVCKKKGCWMKLDLTKDDKQANVRFKDYSFFVPMDSEGRTAVVHGKAYVAEVSVAKLRHYAEDAGKSEAEIEAITKPETQYLFMADGVLIAKD